MAETRLLADPCSSSVRTDTGIHATSDSSGRSPRSLRYLRSVPDMMANTTSFTLTPNASLISLAPDSGTRAKPTRRWGVIAELNGVGGAVRGSAP